MRNRWWAGPGIAVAVLVIAACGSNGSPPSSAASKPAAPASGQANAIAGAVTIKMMTTSKGTVLANPDGLTLYWFANDTPSQSNCNASCATYWPPVMGAPAAAAGTSLPHGFGTIKRANGQLQATYDGHPLYTYTGDTSAGMVTGNGLNVSGGLWWAVTPTGTELSAAASSGSGSSSAGSGSSSGGW